VKNIRKFLPVVIMTFLVEVSAQAAYPDRAIRIIIPTEAGGVVDVPIRAIVPGLSKALEQTLIVENRPGAGSLIGVQAVKNSAPDGYMLLATGTGSLTVSPVMRPNGIAFEDFVNIGIVSSSDLVLLAGAHTSYETLQGLIAYAKANPGVVNFASNGVGSTTHMQGTALQRKTGTSFTHIAYKGNPASVSALLGKQSDIMLASASVVIALIQSRQLRALATTGTSRSETLPNVPTFREAGVDQTYESRIALFAPAAVPAPIVDRLRQAFQSANRDEGFKATLRTAKLDPVALTPAESAAEIRREYESWRELFRDPAFRKAVAE
jgi:tripartite-type tricarboxylate transporter receptor subunit TctC